MIHASPTGYQAHLDGAKVEQLRNQFVGEYRGLKFLSSELARREAELRETIATKQKETQ